MIKVGDMVMVRDPAITDDVMIPPAKVIKIKTNKHKETFYLLEFSDESRQWMMDLFIKTV